MQKGSYQFENLVSRDLETTHLLERAQLRLEGFVDLLVRHHFPTQGNILEIGCAHGIRTYLMAKHFPKVSVVGIDRTPDFLKIASENYRDITNLSFQFADIYELPFADSSFDFIYARLVFMHLAEPMLALKKLKRVLRPGGILLIEDADRDCMFFEPQPASFKMFWQKVQEGQRRLGGDPNMGRKIAPYLKAASFQNLKIEIQPIIGTSAEISFLVRTLMPSLNLYLGPEDRKEGEIAISDLEQLSKNPCASFYHFWFVISGENAK